MEAHIVFEDIPKECVVKTDGVIPVIDKTGIHKNCTNRQVGYITQVDRTDTGTQVQMCLDDSFVKELF